jgi:hypothetical protein
MVAPTKETAKIKHVQEVMNTMSKSPTAVYLKGCSYHERVMLAALLKCMKREGVEEIKWGDVCLLSSSLVMPDSDFPTFLDSSSLNIFPTTTSSPPPQQEIRYANPPTPSLKLFYNLSSTPERC